MRRVSPGLADVRVDVGGVERSDGHEVGAKMAGEALDLLGGTLSRDRLALGRYRPHDIGKSIVAVALRSRGFGVHDLGVNVAPQTFAEKALEVRPGIVGISALLTTSYDSIRKTVESLKSEVLPQYRPIPVIVGGGTVSDEVCCYVGADYAVRDVLEGVRICERILPSHGAPEPA